MDIIASDVGIMKDIIMSIAACITAGVAYSGLNKWKKELRGKIDFDTAHALLKATYKVRDGLHTVRSPFFSSYEFPSDYNPLDKNSKIEYDAYLYAYNNRMKPLLEAIQEFNVSALEAEVLWGHTIQEYSLELNRCCSKVQRSIEFYLGDMYSNNVHKENHPDFFNKKCKDLFAEFDDEENDVNLLTQRINSAITNIENVVKPYLNRK